MQYKKNYYKYLLRLEPGEELVSSLEEFCLRERVGLGSITGAGAVRRATVALSDQPGITPCTREVSGNFKLSPLSGSISSTQNKPCLRLYVNLEESGRQSVRGILSNAIVSTPCEIIIDTIESELDRRADHSSRPGAAEF